MSEKYNNFPDRAHGSQPVNDPTADLITHFKALWPYKWTIVSVATVCVLVATVIVFMLQPVYRATATVLIEAKQSRILDIDNVYNGNADSVAYFATQFQVLSSRALAKKAVAKINWDKYPDFVKEKDEQASWLSHLPFLGTSEEAPPSPKADDLSPEEARTKRLVDAFQAHTNIQPVAGTLLVRVHFLSTYPELTKEAANLITDAYIESGFEAKLETVQRATDWMNDRLKTIRDNLASSQSDLQSYREEEEIINIGNGRGVVEEEFSDNMQRLRDAKRTKTELDNTYRQIQRSGNKLSALERIPALHESGVVQETKSAYVIAQQELKELGTRYGPKHPKIIAAKSKVAETSASYLAQLLNAAEGVRTKYELASENVASYSRLIAENRQDLEQVDRKQYRLNLLEQDTDTNRELYDSILTRFKESNIEGDFQSQRARIIDPALLPESPYKPRKARIMGFAGLGGLFLGILLVVIRQRLDNSIKSADDFEALTGIPVLCNVPKSSDASKNKSLYQHIIEDPASTFAESIRTARTGIVLSDLDKSKKRLLVTSALPQEGKSSIASSLAVSFSQIEKVLLVEADLRRPSLSKYLGLKEKKPGLTELLAGQVKPGDVLQQVSDNVHFLAAGSVPPNPAEILSTQKFKDVMEALAQDYDRVIFDSPPCQPISDTMLLASHVDSAIFVVQYDKTARAPIQVALRRLGQAQVPITGAVLNQYEFGNAYASDYYSYYQDART